MSATIQIKTLSSLEKCFSDDDLSSFAEQTAFWIFRNQRLAFQVGLCREDENPFKTRFRVRISGTFAEYANVRQVISLPNEFPYIPENCDDDYLRKTPGLYPELLRPLHYRGCVTLPAHQLQTLWIDAMPPEGIAAGIYTLTVEILSEAQVCASRTVTVEVLEQALPPQKTIHTEWFYSDCIAEYYHVRAFSEAHWKIIAAFLRTAAENGINMILTPVFTPELDTYIGGERMTTQLLDITVEGKDHYRFGFDRLERWIDLCLSLGITYFEIPHFFTQWGALHAPKFVATVHGRKKKIFGWETDSCGEDYRKFLAEMITALVEFLERKGIADHTFFHISDEPRLKDLEQYIRCKDMVMLYLKGYAVIDALSNYDFYERGALKKPVPAIKHIQPFIDHKVKGLWTYYCGAGGPNTTGRLFSMPLARTRILGVQLYLARIEGFLHWGYNYYHNQLSNDCIDPFLHPDGEFFTPAGDICLVYPGDGGVAWESIRLNAMREAMEDIRMLELCESKCGREAVENIIREVSGRKVTFTSCPTDSAFPLRLRDRVREALGY